MSTTWFYPMRAAASKIKFFTGQIILKMFSVAHVLRAKLITWQYLNASSEVAVIMTTRKGEATTIS
jgi:hypothetical protein